MNLDLVKEIHTSGYKLYIAITGGGQSFIGDFCNIPGASNVLMGAFVPYNQKAFDKFIGSAPDSYASLDAARKMAVTSFKQCLTLDVPRNNAIGIGTTCSLAKENERVGRQHKIYIAVHCAALTANLEIVLNQKRTRIEEDAMVSDAILQIFYYVVSGENPVIKDIDYASGEHWRLTSNNNPEFGSIINQEVDLIASEDIAKHKRIGVYCGSFNPIHDGHIGIHDIATKVLGKNVFLELTVNNVDKCSLDYLSLGERMRHLRDYKYILSNKPTIREKVDAIKRVAPDTWIVFILGIDTWNRIWDTKYGFEPSELEKYFYANDVRFMVFNREGYTAQTQWGQGLIIQDDAADNYKVKISSTEIRKGLHKL